MSELYLIAHKVRGEPAFDVATKLPCPKCTGFGTNLIQDGNDCVRVACAECNGAGHWWIIPTSGHRAYPWWDMPLIEIIGEELKYVACPEGLPDHYQVSASNRRMARANALDLDDLEIDL